MSRRPAFRELSEPESLRLLGTQFVGRLAFTFRDRVDIEPIHYVLLDGRIVGRTQPGTKINVMAHHPWVAFEVDEVRALFEWQSVVVHGRIEFPDPAGRPAERELHARAMSAFRALVPDAFTADDPTPDRTMIFQIPIQELSGRGATTAATP